MPMQKALLIPFFLFLFFGGCFDLHVIESSSTANSDLLAQNEEEILSEQEEDEETETSKLVDILRGIVGIGGLLFITFLFSTHKRRIDWNLVIIGLLLQLFFALLVLKVRLAKDIVDWISSLFISLLDFSMEGANFLFGSPMDEYVAFQIVPPILFFSALTSMLYYLNILQWVVYGFAWVMKKTMRLTGAESLAASANIFIGQVEAPLMVKPYINNMTRSEIMALLTGGMATIAGGVMAAYIGFLGGEDPESRQLFARHLLTASVMSAPASLLVAKIMLPETEKTSSTFFISGETQGENFLDALASGAFNGLKIAAYVLAMVLVFIALVNGVNYILEDFIGARFGLNEYIANVTGGQFSGLKLEFIFGLIFSPLAWLMGVPYSDLLLVGQLLGEKTTLNEFIAYSSLAEMNEEGMLQSKSVIIATYALCGFANFGAMGIQIGGIGSIAPERRPLIAKLTIYSLIGGTITCLMTATIAGMII